MFWYYLLTNTHQFFMSIFANKILLITGGTGSFGNTVLLV